MPLQSAAVSRVLGPGSPPPLNLVESRMRQVPYAMTMTTMNRETWRTRSESSYKRHKNPYIHTACNVQEMLC